MLPEKQTKSKEPSVSAEMMGKIPRKILKARDRVMVEYGKKKRWYAATITAVSSDKGTYTYAVVYDKDGKSQDDVVHRRIRKMTSDERKKYRAGAVRTATGAPNNTESGGTAKKVAAKSKRGKKSKQQVEDESEFTLDDDDDSEHEELSLLHLHKLKRKARKSPRQKKDRAGTGTVTPTPTTPTTNASASADQEPTDTEHTKANDTGEGATTTLTGNLQLIENFGGDETMGAFVDVDQLGKFAVRDTSGGSHSYALRMDRDECFIGPSNWAILEPGAKVKLPQGRVGLIRARTFANFGSGKVQYEPPTYAQIEEDIEAIRRGEGKPWMGMGNTIDPSVYTTMANDPAFVAMVSNAVRASMGNPYGFASLPAFAPMGNHPAFASPMGNNPSFSTGFNLGSGNFPAGFGGNANLGSSSNPPEHGDDAVKGAMKDCSASVEDDEPVGGGGSKKRRRTRAKRSSLEGIGLDYGGE